MIIKDILFTIKEDLKRLKSYPTLSVGKGFSIDYNKYWRKRRGETDTSTLSVWQKQRVDLIAPLIKPNASVLDLGCGDGAVLDYLNSLVPINGIGVDVSDEALEKAKKKGIEAIKLDITDLKNIDKFPATDYITGFEIIEHMPNPEEFICRMTPKVRNGFIFSFPNTGYYAHRLRLLLGRFPLQWYAHPGEHVRFWTVKDVKWWVRAIGFSLEKIIIYQGVPVLNKLFPKLFGMGIIINIKKDAPEK